MRPLTDEGSASISTNLHILLLQFIYEKEWRLPVGNCTATAQQTLGIDEPSQFRSGTVNLALCARVIGHFKV